MHMRRGATRDGLATGLETQSLCRVTRRSARRKRRQRKRPGEIRPRNVSRSTPAVTSGSPSGASGSPSAPQNAPLRPSAIPRRPRSLRATRGRSIGPAPNSSPDVSFEACNGYSLGTADDLVTAAEHKYQEEQRSRDAHRPQQDISNRAFLLFISALQPILHFDLHDCKEQNGCPPSVMARAAGGPRDERARNRYREAIELARDGNRRLGTDRETGWPLCSSAWL